MPVADFRELPINVDILYTLSFFIASCESTISRKFMSIFRMSILLISLLDYRYPVCVDASAKMGNVHHLAEVEQAIINPCSATGLFPVLIRSFVVKTSPIFHC